MQSPAKAHAYATTAEKLELQLQYAKAAKAHRSARKHFRRLAEKVAEEKDHQTLRALDLLVKFHTRRAKELGGDSDKGPPPLRQISSVDESDSQPCPSTAAAPDKQGGANESSGGASGETRDPCSTSDGVVQHFEHLQALEKSLSNIHASKNPCSTKGMGESRIMLGESFCLVGRDDQTVRTPSALLRREGEVRGNTSSAQRGRGSKVAAPLQETRLAQQQQEIGRLLHTVQRLTLENNNLASERDNYARRLKEQTQRTVQFREEYQKRFALLKRAMEQFSRREQEPSALRAGESVSMPAAAGGGLPDRGLRAELDASEARVRELQQQQRKLVERVRAETAEKTKAKAETRKLRQYLQQLKQSALENRRRNSEAASKPRSPGVSGP